MAGKNISSGGKANVYQENSRKNRRQHETLAKNRECFRFVDRKGDGTNQKPARSPGDGNHPARFADALSRSGIYCEQPGIESDFAHPRGIERCLDEEKHDKILETLSTIKKGMYPYG